MLGRGPAEQRALTQPTVEGHAMVKHLQDLRTFLARYRAEHPDDVLTLQDVTVALDRVRRASQQLSAA